MKCFIFVFLFLVGLTWAKKDTLPNCHWGMRLGCPKIFVPLCGSNGKTYANQCELCVKSYSYAETGLANITIQYEGECSGDTPINGPSEQEPPSETSVDVVTFPRPAACHKYRPSFGCSKMYLPVCGSDGQTYSNQCLLCLAIEQQGKQITIAKATICEEKSFLSKEWIKNVTFPTDNQL